MTICPVLVGRRSELEELATSLDDASQRSSPVVVLIHGEAGIGKTRLVKEFLRATDADVLTVECTKASQVVPFGALDDALGSRGRHPVHRGSIAVGPGSARGRDDAKRQHHRALSDSVMLALGDQVHRVMLIEDLHWCDDATMEWLPHLLRTVAGPLMVVVTFRDELPDPAMKACLAELDRLRVTTDVTVDRLRPVETIELIELVAPGSRRVAEIADLSGGNPLYAEELCHLVGRELPWPVTRSTVPRLVAQAVDERRSNLSDRAAVALGAVAVLGREFSVEFLGRVAPTLTDAASAVDELVRADLIREMAPGRFSLRHALFGAATLVSMRPSQRSAMHRSVAVALESGLAGRPALRAGELLHHWSMVGEVDKVEVWAMVACDQAFAAHSPSDARSRAESAIELLVRERGEASHQLLRRRGEAHAWLGDFTRAEQDHRAALGVASASSNTFDRWRSLVDLGALAVEHDSRRAGEYFQEALALVRELDNDHGLAETLAWIGFWRMMDGDPQSALGYQKEALAVLDGLGDRQLAGEVLDLLGWTNYTLSDLRASSDAYRRGIAVNRAAASAPASVGCEAGYATRGGDCFQLDAVWCDGEPLAWAADGELAIQHAREFRWRSGEARATIWLGLHLAALGEYGRAIELAACGIEIAEADGQVRFASTGHILQAAIWLDLMDPARALERGAIAWRLANELWSPTVAATALSFIARSQIELGSLDAARATLDNVVELASNSMPDRLITSARVQLDLANGEFGRALAGSLALSHTAPNAETGHVIPRLSYLRGLALVGLGRDEEADTCLAEAAGAATRLRQRPLLWRILLAAGDITSRLGGAAAAAHCYRSARRVIDEVTGTIPDPATASTFRTLALRAMPSDRGAGRGDVGLTAREREITALVARGMTNREIADHLVLSVRTVEKHVANALIKLDMHSRVELAVWAAGNS